MSPPQHVSQSNAARAESVPEPPSAVQQILPSASSVDRVVETRRRSRRSPRSDTGRTPMPNEPFPPGHIDDRPSPGVISEMHPSAASTTNLRFTYRFGRFGARQLRHDDAVPASPAPARHSRPR